MIKHEMNTSSAGDRERKTLVNRKVLKRLQAEQDKY